MNRLLIPLQQKIEKIVNKPVSKHKGKKAKVKGFSFLISNVVIDNCSIPFATGFVEFPDKKQCYISLPLALVDIQEAK